MKKFDEVFSVQEVAKMMKIYNSDMDEKDKVKELAEICNLESIRHSISFHDMLNLKTVKDLKKLEALFERYERMDYFKNPYKCSLKSIDVRVENLKKISSIIKNEQFKNIYSKAEQLLAIYNSSEQFRRAYSLFIKYGKNDKRLDSIRKDLEEFDTLLEEFRKCDGLIDDITYVQNMQKYYLPKYEYSEFIAKCYLKSKLLKDSEFYNKYGIDENGFKACMEVLDMLNVDLYKKVVEKKESNIKALFMRNKTTIDNLINGIKTGLLNDGTPFDLLQFIKRTPFKGKDYYMDAILSFAQKNNSDGFEILNKYLRENNFNYMGVFKPLNLKELYSTKVTVNDREITKEDIDNILDYLRLKKIPIIAKSYTYVRNKYLAGEITPEMIEELRKENPQKENEKAKVKCFIIPRKQSNN